MANTTPLIGRRYCLRTTFIAGAAGATGLLAACGGKKKTASKSTLSCKDTSGLTPAEKQMREQLAYVDKSPQAAKNCANCSFFQSKGDNACGGCTLIKGPIHPQGYCNSWAEKQG